MKAMKRVAVIGAGLVAAVLAGVAADEITTQLYLKAEKGYTSIIRSPTTLKSDWTGTRVYGPVVYSLTTNYTAFARGQIATNGIAFVRHVGTSNTVDISMDNGTNAHLRINAGEFFMFRLHPTLDITTVQAKGSANVELEVTLIEN